MGSLRDKITVLVDIFRLCSCCHDADYVAEDAIFEAVEKCAAGRRLRESVTDDDVAAQFLELYLADLLHVHFRVSPQQHEVS